MRAAVYARVPTERQERQQTIDSQLAALRAWAGEQGHAFGQECGIGFRIRFEPVPALGQQRLVLRARAKKLSEVPAFEAQVEAVVFGRK